MKKLFVVMTAIAALFAFSQAAFAANQVQVTLTSPIIYKAGCEKAGSVTMSFDEGSVINSGDWWYFDLPNNVTLCKNYSYVIAGNAAVNPSITPNTTDFTNSIFNNGGTIAMTSVGGSTAGPVLPKTAGTTDTVNTAVTVTGNMAFYVKGTSGSRRVTIYAVSDADAAGAFGNSSIAVAGNYKLDVKIFDGVAHSNTNAGNNNTVILIDSDSDGTFGETAASTNTTVDEVIGNNDGAEGAAVPYVENTLCINAESYGSEYVYTSFASKSDKFTFTGDSQIAHTGTASSISLASCKGATTDDIDMSGGQSSTTCIFDYDDSTALVDNAADYCTEKFENRFLIQATSVGGFGDLNDQYTVDVEITSPADGVYFGGYPVMEGYDSTASGVDPCTGAGTTLVAGAAANYTGYTGSTKLTTVTFDNDCTVGTNGKVDSLKMNVSAKFALDLYDNLYVNFADFVYDNTNVTAGEEVTVQVTLNREPCGQIFQASRTIGTFVSGCSNATSTTLYFPWLPGTAAAGWWGGYAITNVGSTAGNVVLTYNDSEGDSATYTVASVAAGAQWTDGAITSSDLTDVSGETYDATLNYSVRAVCGFTAEGFAFTGNNNISQAVGYTAEN